MQSHVILTAIGTDRLGIVDDLSQDILRRSCNIEESRMATFRGRIRGPNAHFGFRRDDFEFDRR